MVMKHNLSIFGLILATCLARNQSVYRVISGHVFSSFETLPAEVTLFNTRMQVDIHLSDLMGS